MRFRVQDYGGCITIVFFWEGEGGGSGVGWLVGHVDFGILDLRKFGDSKVRGSLYGLESLGFRV